MRITGGRIAFETHDLTRLARADLRRIRGRSIGMVFQEPMLSLNPCVRIGDQMAESLRIHTRHSAGEIRRMSIAMLERIRLRDPAGALRAYPHEFSGGMRQRIMLASVLLMRPRLLIADEPTTALDALIQKEVLDIMVELTRELGTAVLLITHDLGLVGRYAQDMTVMRQGRVVEAGAVAQVLAHPREDYTRELLAAVPKAAAQPAPRPAGTPLLDVNGLTVAFEGRRRWPWSRRSEHVAVNAASFSVEIGETVAVVGESGSGKTTLGRALLRLKEARAGRVLFRGEDVLGASAARMRELRREMQIVFQDPASSLDPRMRVRELVGEGLRHAGPLSEGQRRERVDRTLREIGLGEGFAERFPHELSGGQRQRVAIGRAIVMGPTLIVADEPVSALDVTIQAQIVQLLKRLQAEHGFAYLFISHDLGVIEEIASRVAVMLRGHIVELAPRARFFARPGHPYSRRLLNSSVEVRGDAGTGYAIFPREVGEAPPPAGRQFFEGDGIPELVEVAPGHWVACLKEPA
jgi:peptide/nickel transport system ATP-binding protein